MPQTIPISRLLERTIELLVKRPEALTLSIIEEETGLSQAWLTYLLLKRNGGVDPSVNRVVLLYEYLSHRKIEI